MMLRNALSAVVVASVLAAMSYAAPVLAQQPGAVSNSESMEGQFQRLYDELDHALASRDAEEIAARGHAIRAFQVPPDTIQFERHAWRREKLRLWLSAVSGAHDSADPKFDAADAPYLNVTPPIKDGVPTISGMDPESIADADLQEAYRDRIDANTAKVRSHSKELMLRKLHSDWTYELQAHVTSQYAATPSDIQEVKWWIDTEVSDIAQKGRLRDLLIEPLEVVVRGSTVAAEQTREEGPQRVAVDDSARISGRDDLNH
jgi:hypothetical protein